MFKRFRRLRISLATKCQILFGAAVVLIIAAALSVPWQRMEWLTLQQNQQSAAALAAKVLADHILKQTTPASPTSPSTSPAPSPTREATSDESVSTSLATVRPAVAPATQSTAIADAAVAARGSNTLLAQLLSFPPRLLPIDIGDDANLSGPPLTRFEKKAISHFKRHSDSLFLADNREEPGIYHYMQAVYFTHDCAACHVQKPEASTLTSTTLTAQSIVNTSAPRLALAGDDSRLVGIVSVAIPTRVEENQLLLNRIFIMTAGLLAGSLAILCFYLITTRLILQPVRVLQETAEKVSKGDLNIRSDISTGDEFQQLAETFNTMLANLKQTTDQLRAINTSLDLKLGQLAEANLALYESNRLKSEFLANVSHELRTPLNSILGFADLLRDAMGPVASAPDSKPQRYVGNILQSGKHLLELINDLLDLAKIEAGRMEVRSEPLSLSDLFEGLTNILKPLCEPRKLTIAASIASDVPILHTDPGKLQQVLYNFLSNAIKFSPAGSQIELTARRESANSNKSPGNNPPGNNRSATTGDDFVHISVTDQGPGIAAESQQLIFEKFRQVDASVTRAHGGSGLGLAISKELTALIAGTIGVKSAANAGATFWIRLPVRIEASTQDMRHRLMLS